MIQPMTREESTRTHDSDGFRKFCQETSLHGWFYFSSDASKWWKMLWLIFLCLIICLSSYVLGANVNQYMKVTEIMANTTVGCEGIIQQNIAFNLQKKKIMLNSGVWNSVVMFNDPFSDTFSIEQAPHLTGQAQIT